MNPKKVSLAYKKYTNNYIKGNLIQRSKENYADIISEITDIIESDNTEKDYILSIDLGTIYTYYSRTWKEDVLLQNRNRSEALKLMYMSTFYQCITQELYELGIPDYTFSDVVAALIHFTMFGWEKEEHILFDFIADHLDEKIMKANDWNKHVWFLLELYLQYRNKTLWGINQHVHRTVREKLEAAERRYELIPDDLGIYSEVLASWSTADEKAAADLIGSMILYHSELASDLGHSIEFGDYRYGFYPYEILFLIHVRQKQGLPVPEQYEELLMNTAEAKMTFEAPEPYPQKDPLLVQIDGYHRKHYPKYALNRYDDTLFEK